MVIRGTLVVALALIGGCATQSVPPDDFATLDREFGAQYEALRIPGYGPAYVANLEGIGSAESIAGRSRFFSEWQARLGAFSREALDRKGRLRYDTLRFEIDFNL